MLRNIPSLDQLRHEIRRRICSQCYRRPPHSESLGPEVVRPCELSCPVFVHLPTLRKIAVLRDPMLASRRDAVEHRINEVCGDELAADPSVTCSKPSRDDQPLRRYRKELANAVLELAGEI
jgi:hypothetical protein